MQREKKTSLYFSPEEKKRGEGKGGEGRERGRERENKAHVSAIFVLQTSQDLHILISVDD